MTSKLLVCDKALLGMQIRLVFEGFEHLMNILVVDEFTDVSVLGIMWWGLPMAFFNSAFFYSSGSEVCFSSSKNRICWPRIGGLQSWKQVPVIVTVDVDQGEAAAAHEPLTVISTSHLVGQSNGRRHKISMTAHGL